MNHSLCKMDFNPSQEINRSCFPGVTWKEGWRGGRLSETEIWHKLISERKALCGNDSNCHQASDQKWKSKRDHWCCPNRLSYLLIDWYRLERQVPPNCLPDRLMSCGFFFRHFHPSKQDVSFLSEEDKISERAK